MGVGAEAHDTRRIRVFWQPLPQDLQNGLIRKYSVLYHPTFDPRDLYATEVTSGTEVLLVMPRGEGVSYSIRVAAVTVEVGPFSEAVVQQTYPRPPAFSSGPPTIVPGFNATENTIPIQLPAVNITQFRFIQ